jgi:hypothetical protein
MQNGLLSSPYLCKFENLMINNRKNNTPILLATLVATFSVMTTTTTPFGV